jgi:glycosyltransferase involved in cell wall biosynthesis
MRVVYVCADPGVPVFGSKGSSVHVQSILRAFLRLGARVDLLATRAGGRRPSGLEDVRLHRLPSVLPGAPERRERAAQAANGALEAILNGLGPFDLLYERCSLWSHAALEHAWHAGIPSVLEVNAPLIDEQAAHRVLVDRDAADAIAERQAAGATILVAVSEPVAGYLRARHPMAADRVHVVPNGVDPERFPPHLLERRAAPGRPFTTGFLGTLKPWHGLPVLVEAFESLRMHHPDARLLVVGDGPERKRLESDLAAAGLRGAATLTGAVPPDRVPALLASMDASVAPYPAAAPFYFSPLKVLESMAAGVPVVAARVGQVESLIQDRRTGVLVPPGDADRVAAALVELALRPLWRQQLGRAARRTVLARHTWDQVLGRVLQAVDVTAPSSPRT